MTDTQRPDSNSNFQLKQLYSWSFLAFTLLLPLLVIPLTQNFIWQTKFYLTTIFGLWTLVCFLILAIKKGTWRIIAAPFSGPVLLLTLVTLASTFFSHPYPVENLLGSGGWYLSFGLLVLLAPSLIDDQIVNPTTFIKTLALSSALVAATDLLQIIGFGPSRFFSWIIGLEIEQSTLFNLTTSPLVAAQLSLLSLIGLVLIIVKEKKITAFTSLVGPALLVGLGINIWSMLPNQPAALNLPSWAASWSIALDSIREPKTLIIGQGPESYLTSFNQFKPLWLNQLATWQNAYSAGSNFPLTILVKLGLGGLISWALIWWQFLRSQPAKTKATNQTLKWLLIISFLFQLGFPENQPGLIIQALLLVAWITQLQAQLPKIYLQALNAKVVTANNEPTPARRPWFQLSLDGLLIIGCLVSGWLLVRSYQSQYQLFLAQKAIAKNLAVDVYEHQRQAVEINPYLDTNRRSYALTNLDLALAIANKAELADSEKQQVSQLISQAVREAKAATSLDPADSRNWTVLAQIYAQLIGSAEGADQWTVDAYLQAITTSPADPTLRLALAEILKNLNKLDSAINVANQAIELKSDLPASYYLLGTLLKANQKPAEAQQAWQATLQLLDANSEEAAIVQEELKKIADQVPAATNSNPASQTGTPATVPTVPTGAVTPSPATTPLGDQLPSLTDQAIEEIGQEPVSQPANQPLTVTPGTVSPTPDEVVVSPNVTPEN